MSEKAVELFRASIPIFQALSDSARQDIILLLAEKEPLTVNEIANESTLSRPAISHHLKILRDQKLVQIEQKGTQRYYSLALNEAVELLKTCLLQLKMNVYREMKGMNHERFYITDETVIEHIVSTQKQYFYAQKTKSISSRIQALNKLRDAVKQNEQRIMDALKQDLNKSEVEAYTSEIGILLEEIRFTLKHLAKWMKPKKVKTALTHVGSKGKIVPEPYGVALIIAPWNYPFQLALSPLVGAIAAGNTAIIKPSELTPSVSRVIQELLAEAFDPAFVTVIEGAVETTSLLLKQALDYIFFTGSVNVGKIIMQEAGKQLIPVTLELGGKSPCIVHEDANLDLAAKRIMFGKGMNAGQTCVAPDYLLVHKK